MRCEHILFLSPALTAVLYDLSRQIPQLKKDIQDGLLKMLSLVLMHKPLRHPGMPKGLAHQLASPSLTNIPEASDVGSITLALRTLGSFEFEGEAVWMLDIGNGIHGSLKGSRSQCLVPFKDLLKNWLFLTFFYDLFRVKKKSSNFFLVHH